MTVLHKLVLTVLVLLAVEAAWLCRWGIVPAATKDWSAVYELDRWTGDIYWVVDGNRVLVKQK
jgi:hypothetical protein